MPSIMSGRPRLHFTNTSRNNLGDLRAKIAASYKSAYQDFVNWVDNNYNSVIVSQGPMAQYMGLIYQIGPITGVNLGHSPQSYGADGASRLVSAVNQIPNPSGKAFNFQQDDYDGCARAYDWLWAAMTSSQRNTANSKISTWANSMLTGNFKGIKNGIPEKLWSSSYSESFWAFYLFAAIAGDVGDAENKANQSFDNLCRNGYWLDSQNWLAEPYGGLSELGEYGLWHSLRPFLHWHGWWTSTGEDVIKNGTNFKTSFFIKGYPRLMAYRMKPWGRVRQSAPGGREWRLIKAGQMSAHENVFKREEGESQKRYKYLLIALGETLKRIDNDMAKLNRWLLNGRIGESLSGWEQFFPLIFGDKTVAAQSPSQLGLPASERFTGMGLVSLRTGLNSADDTAMQIIAPTYGLTGHSWGKWTFRPGGFSIDKYGPLALVGRGDHRGSEYLRKNMMRFGNTTAGFIKSPSTPPTVHGYTPQSQWYLRGITKARLSGNQYRYVFCDYTKWYDPNIVVNCTRQHFFMVPNDNEDHTYIVIFDRTQTLAAGTLKRWGITCAYEPTTDGNNPPMVNGKREITGNPSLIEINNDVNPDPYITHGGSVIGGHGVLFVKTLLPTNRKIIQRGGPGYEFVADDGSFAQGSGYSNEGADYKALQEVGAFYVGTYHNDVTPTASNQKENFLHFLQASDADTTSNPVNTRLIQGGDLQGVQIQGSSGNEEWVLMFGKNESVPQNLNYTVQQYGGSQHHLVADLSPAHACEVFRDGQSIGNFSTNQQGILDFTIPNVSGSTNISIVTSGVPSISIVLSVAELTLEGQEIEIAAPDKIKAVSTATITLNALSPVPRLGETVIELGTATTVIRAIDIEPIIGDYIRELETLFFVVESQPLTTETSIPPKPLDVNTMTLAGQDSTLIKEKVLPISTGLVSLAAMPSGSLTEKRLSVAEATINMQGVPITAAQSKVQSIPAGAIGIAGQEVIPTVAQSISTATTTVAPQPVTAVHQAVLGVGKIIMGQKPITNTFVISLTAAEITLQPQQPTVNQEFVPQTIAVSGISGSIRLEAQPLTIPTIVTVVEDNPN